MSRIRSIKPDFYKHEGLYDLEQETGFPIRTAFSGLWTVCDREGRFEWRPRRIKADVLPYDELNFGDVLDALERCGFIESYNVNGAKYGWIPSFLEHQRPNKREPESTIPDPAHARTCTHVQDNAPHEHARVEGEGEGEREMSSVPSERSSDASDLCSQAVAEWNAFAEEHDLSKAQKLTNGRRASLKRRLADCGGIEGWRHGLQLIRGSPFLLGENDRGWKANLDFLLQEKSFTKLMEGAYAERTGDSRSTTQPVSRIGTAVQSILRTSPEGDTVQ